jgi:hypothetical protein
MILKRGVIQFLKFIAFLSVGIFLLWLAFRAANFRELADILKKADYSWLALSVFFGFMAYLSRARRWMLLIHSLGYYPSFAHVFHAMMSGYLANTALPRIGEITRCVALNRKEKIPVDQLVGTVVLERTIDLLSLLSIMTVLIITSGTLIRQFLNLSILIPLKETFSSFFGFTWIIWVILVIVIISGFTLIVRFKKNLRKIRFFSKIFDIARGVINGLKTITILEKKWEFVFHTFFIWLNYALMTWVVVFSIESTSHLTFANSIFILVIGGLAMSAPVQGGIGAFHYIVSRGIAFVENVKIEDGQAYAILTHESELIFALIIGTISFFIMFGRHRKKNPAPDR